jgi:hypothetical protein
MFIFFSSCSDADAEVSFFLKCRYSFTKKDVDADIKMQIFRKKIRHLVCLTYLGLQIFGWQKLKLHQTTQERSAPTSEPPQSRSLEAFRGGGS